MVEGRETIWDLGHVEVQMQRRYYPWDLVKSCLVLLAAVKLVAGAVLRKAVCLQYILSLDLTPNLAKIASGGVYIAAAGSELYSRIALVVEVPLVLMLAMYVTLVRVLDLQIVQ